MGAIAIGKCDPRSYQSRKQLDMRYSKVPSFAKIVYSVSERTVRNVIGHSSLYPDLPNIKKPLTVKNNELKINSHEMTPDKFYTVLYDGETLAARKLKNGNIELFDVIEE
jgi:hypothetical protein